MFGLFKSRKISDTHFGELSRSCGFWRSTIKLGSCADVPLAVAGPKDGPDTSALAEAHQVVSLFPEWQPIIEQALFEHFEPYFEAIAAGEYPVSNLQNINSPKDVLTRAKLQFVAIGPIGGTMTTELGYEAEWDEEHLLGVRFQAGKFVELCGSTVPASIIAPPSSRAK